MNIIKKILPIILLPYCSISFSGQTLDKLQVSSTIENSCSFKVHNVSFGEWNINIGETIRNLTINVLCNRGTSYLLEGEDKAGPYPHQNGTSSWQKVIKMPGTNPNNKDWLAYRIHYDIPSLPLFATNKNSVPGLGTGDYFSHNFKVYLFGNTKEFPGRFIAVTPDVYSDNFAVTISY